MPQLMRNGTSLAYAETGTGGDAVVLLHGLACNKEHFRPQLDHFGRTRRVVALDLRGHGESGEGDGPFVDLADDVAWVCQQLGLSQPVLVGHSMGGNIAVEAVRRHPSLVRAVVMIDSPVAMPPEVQGMMGQAMAGLYAAKSIDAWAGFCEQQVGPSCPAPLRARILADFVRAGVPLLEQRTEQMLTWDAPQALQACQVPLLFIQGVAPFSEDVFRAASPHAQVVRLEGAGHYSTLEAPAQVNTLLERFLSSLPPLTPENGPLRAGP